MFYAIEHSAPMVFRLHSIREYCVTQISRLNFTHLEVHGAVHQVE